MLLRDANLDAIAFPLAPPPPILNPTAESTEKDATSGGIHDSVPCLVVDLRLEDDTVVDCQSSERSSVSNSESEEACRICHVSSGCTGSASELIELRCGCKNGLGVVHKHCAEAWFRIKGNRCCEICGSDAKNINGLRSREFIDIWHDRRDATMQNNQNSSSERRDRCWTGQLFCSFFITCVLVAFIVPWFFRLNMF